MVTEYIHILENVPFMTHSIDVDGRIICVSDRWLDFFGYERNEVVGKHSTDFLTEKSVEYAKTVVLPQFFKDGKCESIHYEFIKKNGDISNILLSASLETSNETSYSIAILTDITTRNNYEKIIKSSEERFKLLSNLTNEAIVLHINGTNILDVNESFTNMFGYTAEEAKVLSGYDFISPKAHDIAKYHIENNSTNTYESIGITKDGVEFPIEVHASMMEVNGDMIRVSSTVDITERKQNQVELDNYRNHLEDLVRTRTTELHDAMEMYKTLARVSPVCIMRTSESGGCDFVNKKWCDLTGLTKEESKDMGWIDAIYHEDLEKVKISIMNAVVQRVGWTEEFRIVDKNGIVYWVICSGNIVNGGSSGHVVTFTNITKKKEILPQLLNLQLMMKNEATKRGNHNG